MADPTRSRRELPTLALSVGGGLYVAAHSILTLRTGLPLAVGYVAVVLGALGLGAAILAAVRDWRSEDVEARRRARLLVALAVLVLLGTPLFYAAILAPR